MTESALLRMESISKSFPGVQALQDVNFAVLPGEIHALVGENGAGKSTLMKALTGGQPADDGRIIWRGQPVDIQNPHDAQALGISMIHQELSLLPFRTVGQNVYLGREPTWFLPGTINWKQLYAQTGALLQRLDLDVDPRTEAQNLSIAQQQMVEVAKALSIDASLIAMDEPTSSLTEKETEILFDVMRSLKAQGVSIIFISHRLEEVFEISDRVTVLRDGRHIATKPTSELDHNQIVSLMVGRELDDMYHYSETERQDVALQVRDLSEGRELKNGSLTLHGGEILGIAGLIGAGRTALAETLFGIRRATAGEIWLAGEKVKIHSPQQAIKQGLGFVPEDRKLQGLFLNMAVRENIDMSSLDQVSQAGFIKRKQANAMGREFVEKLDIRTPRLDQTVGNLSGGNQQKVVIARWLTLAPQVLILDEPTRGVDVGAKSEIHALMRDLAAQGVGVLMISSDLPEVLGVSDRILVMHEGRVTGEFSRAEATQDKIMHAATGGGNDGKN
ncbi:MAG TPA: sugar ABC transporter ATP-binding protein [Anaerolineae bacterium]|nr:sugar ABC transporter ATP-binding protein [Anaerolineae bacterium]